MNEEIVHQQELQAAKQSLEGQSLEKFFQSYQIPDEKVDHIAGHFQKLRKKFPHMKYDRLFKKTANYFNLKKV